MNIPAPLWEGRAVDEWRADWRVPEFIAFDAIGSTNDVARQRAFAGAPAGLVVLADRQVDGRGRMGRQWVAASGSSLLFSSLVRPDVSADPAPGTLPIRVGAVVARTLRTFTGLDATVKWPNDIMMPDHIKVAGILCEGLAAGTAAGFVVVGIGINVRQHADDWPVTLRDTATSIDARTGRHTSRPALLAALIDGLRPLWNAPLEPLSDEEIEAFRDIDALHGSRIAVHAAQNVSYAIADGVAPDGALLARREDGSVDRITSATIRRADDFSLQNSP